MNAQTRSRMHTLSVGLSLTLLVVVLDAAGALRGLEHLLYDLRARWFQFAAPPVTDTLVHLDIDDAALEAVGRWPWPRGVLAATIDELRRAEPAVVAFDVIFSEPSEPSIARRLGDVPIDHDAALERAFAGLGQVILAAEFEAAARRSEAMDIIADALREDLTLSSDAVVVKLRGRIDAQTVREQYHLARRQVMLDRLAAVPDALTMPEAELAAAVLPEVDGTYTDSPQLRLMRAALAEHRAHRAAAARRWAQDATGAFDAARVYTAALPLARFVDAVTAVGSVYFEPDTDGVVRRIPLWVIDGQDIHAQLGAALALRMQGIDQRHVMAKGRVLDIRQSDDTVAGHGEAIGRGGRQPIAAVDGLWGENVRVPHLSVGTLWLLHQTRQRIAGNNATADDALRFLLSRIDPAKLDAYFSALPASDDARGRNAIIDWTLAETAPFVEMYAEFADAELKEEDRLFLQSVADLKTIKAANAQLDEDLRRTGDFVRKHVAGKAVLFGWTATGATDVVPTSLHARCPGVVVHGMIFNSIMTGELWHAAPRWIGPVVALLFGVLTTLSSIRFSPLRSAVVVGALGGGYAVFNGLVLFDYGNAIVPLAGTLSAVALVWAGCTFQQFIAERRERARITQRFSSYVDPALVSYVLENPDQMKLEGEVRELTVVFTDLAGFTTISERLREATVSLLNEYMGIMVPLIRQQGGYVNKFLGDGIMFFYGAPRRDEAHAVHALTTVLRMQQALLTFNQSLAQRDLPPVAMRAGIATGDMVVGDAGPTDAADYTVLGDVVNLSARLESANKATGTYIMVNDRTAELVGDAFLLRRIGTLQVVGKTQGVKVFEPLAFTNEATDAQRQTVALTAAMIDAYVAGEFGACVQAADAMDMALGKSKLASLYRDLAARYMQTPPEEFDGTVVLTSK